MKLTKRSYSFVLSANGLKELSYAIGKVLYDFNPYVYNFGQKFISKVKKNYRHIESSICYQSFNDYFIMSIVKLDKHYYKFNIIITNN